MKIEIKNKYLIFPVNQRVTQKKIYISDGKHPAYALNMKLDYINPDYYAYINVERYMGKTVEITAEQDIEIKFSVSDEMVLENLYKEPLRPQVHFTTKNGWINDPNGLIYVDGVYHLFYQHNPAEPNWQNMHWGHAESTDLIHWVEKDIALFPDEFGTMYSGCAIIDEKNLFGKNTDEHKAVLLFYTHQTVYEQNIAYTNDGFKTFEQYELGTAVPHIADRNRDPKVVFCEELKAYVMVLYLFDDIYQILKSDNLKDWQPVQRIKIPGDRECPDIFVLKADNGKRKWVIMGANDKYIVGNFVNGCFNEEQSAMSLHYGKSAYAGQTFNNLPDGRVVRMVWDRWNIHPEKFNGQMGVPMEFSLIDCDGIYYLKAEPVKEFEGLIKETFKFENTELKKDDKRVFSLRDTPQLIKIKGHYEEKEVVLSLNIFGRPIAVKFGENQICMGGDIAPICLEEDEFEFTIIIDRASIEIFTDKNRAYLTNINGHTLMDRNLPFFELASNKDTVIDSIEINSLKSIWSE